MIRVAIEHIGGKPELQVCQREIDGVAERLWSIMWVADNQDSAGFIAHGIEDRDDAVSMAIGLALSGRFNLRDGL